MNQNIKEIRRTLSLATPMIMGQLATMAMAMVDAAMVGRGVGTESLAALTFALNYTHIPYICLFGMVTATSVLVAEAYGAGARERIAETLRHGIFLCILLSVVVGLVVVGLYTQLEHFNYLMQPPELIPLAQPYMILYSCAFMVALIFACFRSFCEAQDRPWIPLAVLGSAIGLNAFLNWIFIFGRLGFPKMGLTGAGLGTLLANCTALLVIVILLFRNRRLGLDRASFLRLDIKRSLLKKILGLGLPSALQIAVEVGAFAAAAMMMGALGAAPLAAHHVTLQVAAFSFMVPLGMSFAVSIRVGQAAGSGDFVRVRRIGTGAMVLIAIWMLLAAVVIMAARHQLPLAFSDDPVVIALASQFLVFAALFQVFDGLQAIALGSLRGLQDVKVPAGGILLTYWCFALPLAYVLGFYFKYEGQGIWCALLIGLGVASTWLLLRFRTVTARKLKVM